MVLALSASALHLSATAHAAPPNIVVILADDSGWGDYSISGNTNLRTPNIDSIGRAGASFDRFYVCAVCAPTRAEFLTGRYHPRGGVRGVSTGQERLNLDERTVAEAFRAAGYATGAFGKWHNGSQWPYHPNARGFAEFYGFTSGHWGEYFDPILEHNGQLVRGRGYIADDLTDHALAFIEQNRDRPFFCYLPFNTPHSPFCVPDEPWNRFKDHPVPLRGPDGDKEDLPVTRCVLAMMDNLDANVGRVLRRLEELHLAENTIVIYFSDNGPNSWRWNGGMKGRKGSVDEGGVRSVFFIRWPGHIAPGTAVRPIAGAIDLLPTLTALAEVPRVGAKPLDGLDLSPLLLGRGGNWPDRMIFSHQNGNVSVRSQQYRYDQAGALFDLNVDPGQQRNLAADQPAVAARFAAAVAAWRREVLGRGPEGSVAAAAKGKGKAKGGAGLPPDDRPFPVGYGEFPTTWLPARDGVPHGGVKRSATAPNSSYFTSWNSLTGSMTWDIAVHTAGRYEAEIYYTCPAADVGSRVELSCGEASTSTSITEAWNPPLVMDQDRVERVGESYLKEFRRLGLGTLSLSAGRGTLTLRALELTGKTGLDVRAVVLRLRTDTP
jgi:arylsulfatase A-like enzyme